MPSRRTLFASLAALIATGGAASLWARGPARGNFPYRLTEEQWRARLSPAQYRVLRDAGTEPAGSSPLDREKRAGMFHCAGCNARLFDAATKYDSGTGWPSFWRPLPRAVGLATDYKLIIPRTEVHCANCGGHLGHVFDDGPRPTGKRYCLNGLALAFRPV